MVDRTRKDQIRLAAEAYGGAADEAVEEVYRVFSPPEAQAILEDDRTGFIAKAGALAASLSATAHVSNNVEETRARSSRLTTNTERLALIEQDVMEVRKRIFGNIHPPFDHYYPDAVKWLFCNSFDPIMGPPLSGLQDPRAGPTVDDLFDFLVPDEFKDWFEFYYEPRELAYFDPRREKVCKIQTGYGTALDFLRWFLREAASITKFHETALLLHVLTGSRPMLPRWQIIDRREPDSIRTHESTIRSESECVLGDTRHPYESREGWVIVINATDYTLKEHQEVFEAIKELRGPRRAMLDDTDRILLSAIQELGGLPPKGARGNGQFWEDVRTKSVERGVNSFGGRDAPRKRVERLEDRGFNLSALAQSPPTDRSLSDWWRQSRGRESPPIIGDWRKDREGDTHMDDR